MIGRSMDIALRSSALPAIVLMMALAAGCQRGETAKSKESQAATSTKPAAEEKTEPQSPKRGASLTGRQVLDRMAAAYAKASSYADQGKASLLIEADGQKVKDETADFSVAFVRPNKIHLHAYGAELVCDGRKLYAYVGDMPDQVMVRPAPPQLTLRNIQPDLVVAMTMNRGFAGGLPQLLLLFDKDPLKGLLQDLEEPVLDDPGQIDGRDCYRVKLKGAEGVATFWIDQKTYALRRIGMPTDGLRQILSQERPIDRVAVAADFANAAIDEKIDPKTFQFEVPKGAEIVEFITPPHIAQLLGKLAPDFKFFDLAGKPVTRASLAGKIVVLDFWATWCKPCRESLPNLQKTYERYKNNPKVAFYAVSVNDPKTDNAQLAKTLEQLKVGVPILRDTNWRARIFKLEGIPTTVIIDAKGIMQDGEAGADPKLAEALAKKIEETLAGKNIFEEPLKNYLTQVDQLRQFAKDANAPIKPADEPSAGRETVVRQENIPEAKLAKRRLPSRLKLTPLWKCGELQSPGNVLVLNEKSGPARLLVVNGWNAVAEVGLDGKLLARHSLGLADVAKEAVGRLRCGAGADGRRYTVAFMPDQQRCHVLDDRWNVVAHYPEDALKNPHSGMADILLGDLDGNGQLNMYIGYMGAVGVHAVPMPPGGKQRLWSNRSVMNVGRLAFGAANPQGHRDLFCTNNNGSLVAIDAEGQRQGEIFVPQRMLGCVAAADLLGDGRLLWCGLAASQMGENTLVGFSLKGDELWNASLPEGIHQNPIEPIVAGKLTRDKAGVWLLPCVDGSIRIFSADGRPFDRFDYGVPLQGLATVEIGGRPALIVASLNGLEAWSVE